MVEVILGASFFARVGHGADKRNRVSSSTDAVKDRSIIFAAYSEIDGTSSRETGERDRYGHESKSQRVEVYCCLEVLLLQDY